MKLLISPDGEIQRGAIESGAWVWLPPAHVGETIVAFPQFPMETVIVSPSS